MKTTSQILDEISVLRAALKNKSERDSQEDTHLILSRIHALEWVLDLPTRTQLSEFQKEEND